MAGRDVVLEMISRISSRPERNTGLHESLNGCPVGGPFDFDDSKGFSFEAAWTLASSLFDVSSRATSFSMILSLNFSRISVESCSNRTRSSFNAMTGSRAMTLAVRRVSVRKAISPKISPAPSTAKMVSPVPCVIVTDPARMINRLWSLLPWRMSISPVL